MTVPRARLDRPRLDAHGSALLKERLRGFSLFDPVEYRRMHPDTVEVDAVEHFVEYGLSEGRRYLRGQDIAAFLGAASADPPARPRPEPELRSALEALAGRRVTVAAHAHSDFHVTDLAHELAATLASFGLDAVVDDQDADVERAGYRIVVAPEQFFSSVGAERWSAGSVVASTVFFNTALPASAAFEAALPYLLSGGALIDPHPQTCRLMSESGVPACTFQPQGLHADEVAPAGSIPDHSIARALSRAAKNYDVGGDDLWSERPIDVVFSGTESAPRDEFLARAAPLLSELSCVVRLRRPLAWSSADQVPAEGALARYVGRRTKIALHLHEEEIGVLDWRSAGVDGFGAGALVVSPPCLPHATYKPGVHYLEDSWRRLPQLIEWLLRSTDGRATAERVRTAGREAFLTATFPRRTGAGLVRFLAGLPHLAGR